MKVFLTGATGFVGSHLLRRLLRDGHVVRALVRGGPIVASADSGTLESVIGDLNSKDLAQHAAGCDAVINLVGIIYEHGSSTFESVHHLGTRNLVAAARENGVRRFVQMSALGARSEKASAYHTTKFEAEEEVRRSGISHVVLRPSLIFGPGSAFVKQMVQLMRAVPIVRPLAGTGEYRFRPVHVSDVVECFAQSLTSSQAEGRTIDLVGGEELTLNEIAAVLAECLKVYKIPVHIPMPLMKATAAMLSVFPIKPPVTTVQLRMLEEGSIADPSSMQRVFHIEPASFRHTVKRDLGC